MFRNIFLALIFMTISACDSGGDGGSTGNDPGPFQLTFMLDESFQGPHGNQPIRIALVRLTEGVVMAEDSGIVSGTEDPAFTFTTSAIMERGKSYAVHYWIDSNIGGGTLDVCDPTTFDHQWSTEFYTLTNDINFTVGYEPNLTEYVCNTFI